MACQPENHFWLWPTVGPGSKDGNYLNMPQFVPNYRIPIHPTQAFIQISLLCSGREICMLSLSTTFRESAPLQSFPPFAKIRKSVRKRLRLSPNPFSPGLSISRCRVPNTLPRYHYCTITYQIPPVYYHYRLVSAIINDSSTAAQGRLLTERVWRLWTAWLFPCSLDYFYFYFL